jgi:predicted transcriptional regulator
MSIQLLEQERVVLNIVINYLDTHRQFEIDNIIPFINSRLKSTLIDLNYNGIKLILESLVQKKFLVEGSKLTHEDILRNQKRKDIYEYILKNPGNNFSKIVKELNYSNHVVVWHLSILVKFDFIKKEMFDNHEVYYDSQISNRDAELIYYNSNEKSKAIINYLEENDIGVSKTRLSEDLHMHMNTISKHLSMLVNLRIITSKKIDKRELFFLE